MPPKNPSRRPSKKTSPRRKKSPSSKTRRSPWHVAFLPALLPTLIQLLRGQPALITTSGSLAQLHRNFCSKFNCSIDRQVFDRIAFNAGIRFATGAIVGSPTPNFDPAETRRGEPVTDGHGQEVVIPTPPVRGYLGNAPETDELDQEPDGFTVTNEDPAPSSSSANEAALAALASNQDALLAHTGNPNEPLIIPRSR